MGVSLTTPPTPRLSYRPTDLSTAQPAASREQDPSGANPFAALIQQEYAIIPEFTFESGETLHNVPVAYKTWGKLNAEANNCLILCHALTGSADVEDW